jgi:hypothetical protein
VIGRQPRLRPTDEVLPGEDGASSSPTHTTPWTEYERGDVADDAEPCVD